MSSPVVADRRLCPGLQCVVKVANRSPEGSQLRIEILLECCPPSGQTSDEEVLQLAHSYFAAP